VQLHSCSEAELLRGDVIVALEQARERGYTRYIGYSGDGAAARHAIECGRFDTLQTSISIADQEALDLTLPLARRRNIGVIAKRPLANVAWRTGRKPASAYHRTYWERLRQLDYDFIKSDPAAAVGIALRFTLSVPGVHTAIVGTTNPDRWAQNAALLGAGPLSKAEMARIRARWKDVAAADWTGET
jgi:aryl-alcohol dehydrogenase-like predicted oxidoreductase